MHQTKIQSQHVCHKIVIQIRLIIRYFMTLYQLLILSSVRYDTVGGTRCRSWLRHCATSRKVAGSIPDDIIGIFH
jgi:hypothetical protein